MNESNDGNQLAVTPDNLRWRKSSFSDAYACVGLAAYQGGVGMRNTNRPDAGALFLSREQMAGLVRGIQAGEFDSFLA